MQEPQYWVFWQKEGKYCSNVVADSVNSSSANAYDGRVIIDDIQGQSAKSGVKGTIGNVRFVADNTNEAELFAVSTIYNVSSY